MIVSMTTRSRTSPKLLLLAGSAEARQLAERLLGEGFDLSAWLTEPPRSDTPMPVSYALRDPSDKGALRRDMAGFDAVLDLSHGFDALLSHAGYAAASELGLPFVRFERPAWPIDNPLLQAAPDVASAARSIPRGARVFAATGCPSLKEFVPFRGSRLMLRQTSGHDRSAPYDFVDLIFDTPPFTVEGEMALFRELAVDLLICRNLGGEGSRPKVDAALALGIPVVLIDRPPLPQNAPRLSDLDAIFDWVRNL